MKALAVPFLGLLLAPQPAPAGPSFEARIRPLLAKYCLSCHGATKPKGKLDLSAFADEASVFRSRRVWEAVVQRVRDGEMPPEGKPQPSAAEKALLAEWFSTASARHDAAAPGDPGRAPLRRLNRAEYNNTIRDLLGVDLKPADGFPADDSAHGFDTIAEALALPPLLVEKYVEAAERLLDQVLLPEAPDRRFAAPGDKGVEVDFPVSGRYVLRAKGSTTAAVALRLGGRTIREAKLEKGQLQTEVLTARGKAVFTVAPAAGIEHLEVSGPVAVAGAKEARARLLAATGSGRDAARQILERFSARAWRRSLRPGELDRLLALFDRAQRRGDAFEAALRLPLSAVLSSPHFLFRIEEDRPGTKGPWALPDAELAVRLSYFLWATMPDERLQQAAASGRLSDPAALEAEVRRMLADPKAKALVEGFLVPWLQLGAFEHVAPDNRLFPEWAKDGAIKRSMGDEARLFVEGLLKEDRSLLELIDADYTYLNETLARYYGLPAVQGRALKKVALTDRRRGGVITMGAVLAMTSSPDRTSVVKRGKWILERILGTPPPPPPENAGDLPPEDRKATAAKTLRERLAAHRADPQCATCHQKIDPLGFGLETFDAIGRWRDSEAGRPVDATGTLPNGQSFRGPVELKDLLLARKDEFARSVAEQMVVYALGRGLEDADVPAVRSIAEAVAKDGWRFSRLVVETARSYPFRHRRNPKGD